MTRISRRDLGDFPTPPAIADVLARVTLDAALRRGDVRTVLDPACGEGALLAAACRRMERYRRGAGGAGLIGVEIDQGRARAGQLALHRAGLTAAQIFHGDALRRPPPLQDGAFDAVIANPPFLSPTASRGVLTPQLRQELRARLPEGLAALTNIAALFLADALQLVRPGGVVGMILPASFLTSRDAAPVRAAALRAGSIEWLWTGGTGVFDASVTVCGVVVRRDGRQRPRVPHATGPTARTSGRLALDATLLRDGGRWPCDSTPAPMTEGARIGDTFAPVAGFRLHYYAVSGALHDSPEERGRPVVTAGLIDPGRILWGRIPARIAKSLWHFPRVDDAALAAHADIAGWRSATAVPKVLVATQTRVIECAVDEVGDVIPGVPVIALPASGRTAWRLAAALSSPHLSALAFRRHAGAALSPDAIKMSGAEIAALPLPPPSPAWDRGAQAMHDASRATTASAWTAALDRMADAMGVAYGLSPRDNPHEWWRERLPPFRDGGASR